MQSRQPLFLRVCMRLGLGLLMLAGLCITLGLQARPAHAATTLTVTNCSNDSQLQADVSTANTDNAGDTITFSCSGDIKLTSTLAIAGSMTLDGSGQSVTLDGNGKVGVLSVNSPVTFTLNALTIANGSAPFGGGLYNNSASTVSISNSTFVNNSAPDGGGLQNTGGTVSISNSTFTNNSAISSDYGGVGGAIEISTGTVSISNSTFANNSATFDGDGLYNENGGTLNISGSIVANNTGGNCSGAIGDQGYNLSSDSSCGFTANTDLQNANPRLDPNGLQNNGGPTQTIALQQGSPAIDTIPAASCPATDQRGMTRPDAGETTCDMGAYEFIDPVDNDLALTKMPTNITTNATSPQGAVVTYTPPTVVDEDSPLPTASCSPASGSTFAIGTTTVTCTVSDSDDTNSPVSASFTVTVNPVLSLSVASVTATEGSAFSGVVATGNAYGTSNPLTATINWGDGNSSTVSVTPNADGSYSVSGSHTYAEEGSYTLSVSVKDSGSHSASASGSAKVDDAALALTHFVAGPLGHRAAGVGATFTDADPAGAVSDYTATINWGDGNTSTVKVVKNPVGNGFVLAGLHSYARSGTYTVTLTVTDQGGSQASKTVTLLVK